jgi:hypothetical protein
MQVRMQTQLLSPRMQNRYHSHLHFFGFAKDFSVSMSLKAYRKPILLMYR